MKKLNIKEVETRYNTEPEFKEKFDNRRAGVVRVVQQSGDAEITKEMVGAARLLRLCGLGVVWSAVLFQAIGVSCVYVCTCSVHSSVVTL